MNKIINQQNDLLNKIGNTPLIELESLSKPNESYFAKLENHNPYGSIKDRAAYWMIIEAEKNGILKKNHSIIIEPTSGNTGIALTGIAKSLGYGIEIVIPEKASNETKNIIKSLGAKIYETTDDLCPKVGSGTDQSIALATSIVSSRPKIYYSPNQYSNEANFFGHYNGTGPEIWKQTNGDITHFFTGVGTGGTITGVSTFLKEKNPKIKIIAVQPQINHLVQGLRNFEESAKPELFIKREKVVDDWITITNNEAFSVVKTILNKDKMLVSPSSATVYAAMQKYNFGSDFDTKCIVGIFADDGRKFKSIYVNQNIFTQSEFDCALKKSKYIPKLAYTKNDA